MSHIGDKGVVGRREGQTIRLHHGDSFEVLKSIPDGHLAAVVSDPPYG